MRTSRTSLLCIACATVCVTACAAPRADRALAPRHELVDETLRLDAASVNAHVYGTFAIAFAGGPTAILSGPANFPGNPPGGPGTCVNGLWYNSKGKPTAGTLSKPHPHCTTNGSAMNVVLEPISARVRSPNQACAGGQSCDVLYFSDPKLNALSVVQGFGTPKSFNPNYTAGTGVVVAYAIDASTLGGTNVRVGTLTFDLTQFSDPTQNLFGSCALTDTDDYDCLPLVITATYTPLAVGGVGSTSTATGFLWWAPATAPYNY